MPSIMACSLFSGVAVSVSYFFAIMMSPVEKRRIVHLFLPLFAAISNEKELFCRPRRTAPVDSTGMKRPVTRRRPEVQDKYFILTNHGLSYKGRRLLRIIVPCRRGEK
jgi:hypothetical protein